MRALRISILAAALVAALGACTRPATTPLPGPTSATPTATRQASPPPVTGLVGPGYHDVGAGPDKSTPTAVHDVIAAGRYQTVADVGPGCYWWIYPYGTPAEQIGAKMHGDSPDSGRPVVTLETGQTWQVWGCGTWSPAG